MKRGIVIILILMTWVGGRAAETDSLASSSVVIGNWAVEAAVNTSRIIPTNYFLKNQSGNEVNIAPDVRGSFSFGTHTRYGRQYPNVRQGIGVSLNNILPHSSLGRPVSIYLFQNVRIFGNRKFWMEGEWNFGVSAGWSKYNPDAEVINNAIGSRVNAVLGVNLSAVWKVDPHWGLKASVNGLHFSNGNTHLPNAGVNSIGLMLGAGYYFDAPSEQKIAEPLKIPFRQGFSYDITAYGATRRRIVLDGMDDYVVAKGSFGVAGLNVAAMYDINRYFRAGLSADLQYDESANLESHRVPNTFGEDVKFYRQPFADCFAAGLSLRAELTLPIFSVNVGLGRNIIANGTDTKIFYQTLALKAYVWRGSFLQVGYQLCNFHLPNNLMLGVGYTFGRK